MITVYSRPVKLREEGLRSALLTDGDLNALLGLSSEAALLAESQRERRIQEEKSLR
jgi:hypothetical protein